MSDEFDGQLRQLVSALVAEAPAYEQRPAEVQTGRGRRTPKIAAVVALAAVLAVVVVASILISHGGGDAPASRSTIKFCGLLREIKATVEAPPSLPDPTHGEADLALLSKRYDELEQVAPTAAITRWLVGARPLLGHGLVRFTPKVRAAIPSAQKLRKAVQDACGLDVSDVFKVGFP
jgi:hypothetical protein